jgi:formate dehydrogenase
MTTDWRPTACILCECNCGIEVELGGDDGRQLVRFRGDKQHPISRGYACEKPHRLNYYQNNRDRITEPMRRRPDGTFEVIDWDTAITEVAERLARVRDTHGGDKIFYYGGGGQGNHLPGAYATATRRALGSRYRSNALAQEKTGEFWVSERMLGNYTRGDFEHCDVAVFLGKNPWQSHSIPRARVTLKEIAKDPNRTMIVIDPRRTKTAQLADIHLQVRPGTDAWLLAAMVAVLVEENLVDSDFIANHTNGIDEVKQAVAGIDVAAYCTRAGLDPDEVRRAVRIIAAADAVASMEDLGVQMNRHSTLVSYLHRLVWMTTGNLGKQGTQYIPQVLVPMVSGVVKRNSPVTNAPVIGGLIPCNLIPDEILADSDDRFRAMIVEAANPAHSLADSKRMREALSSLDTLVVIDVAMSETAALADYILPASTQFEKAEATFFNFEFPENAFHLRPRLFEAPEGPLPEAEIHSRLVEKLGVLDGVDLEPLRAAARQGLGEYANAFFAGVAFHPTLSGYASVILYRTLGPALPDGLAEGAVLYGLVMRAATTAAPSLARAGFDGTPAQAAQALFQAMLDRPTGVVFSVDEWSEVLGRIGHGDGRVKLALPDLLDELGTLASEAEPGRDSEFPFVLSAGERRSFTANTIIRDPSWRRKDADGALRLSVADAESLQLANGDEARLVTRRGDAIVRVEVSETMQAGHVSLPNGQGLAYPSGEGRPVSGGISPNELTSTDDRDKFAGTPWHKCVPARVERVQ